MKRYTPIIAALILLLPTVASAASFPLLDPNFTLVPKACQECPCGLGGVLQVVQNLINLAVSVSILILTLIIAYAGAIFMFNATNPEARSQGKKMLTNAVVGFLIVLSAWLIIDFVMKTLYDGGKSGWGPWNEILASSGMDACIKRVDVSPLYDAPTGRTVTVTAGDCRNCTSISAQGVSCKSPNSCTAQPSVVTKLVSLKANYSGEWTVTEAFPPTYDHSNKCHDNATCVDAGLRGSNPYTESNIKAFMDAAKKAGFKPVYEAESCSLKSALTRAGYEARCKSDSGYGHITGNHFSLY